MKYNYYLLLLLLFSTCFSNNVKEKELRIDNFLKNHFSKGLHETSKIINIDKNVFFKLLLETSDSSESIKKIDKFWPFNYQNYYDTIFFIDSTKCTKTFVRFFGGDTIWYTIGFYKNEKRDSTWIIKRPTYKDVKSYKSGKRNGLWQTYYPDGTVGYKCNFDMGTPIDTMFEWHQNGKLSQFEVWKDGESVHHECFDENGKKIECEYD